MKFRLDKKRKKPKPTSKFGEAVRPWRMQIIVGIILTILLALLVTALWYGTRIESLQITGVDVVGGATIKEQVVIDAANSALEGTYYALVPHRFSWWYPKAAVEAAVLAIPRVKQVYVEREGQTVHIAFDEYKPAALWCETLEATQCLFIDTEGYAFAEAPELIGSALVRYVTKGNAPTLATAVLTPQYMETTGAFSAALEAELGFYVTHVVRTDEVDTSYVLSTGAEIKVTDRMTAAETLANLKSVLFSDEFSSISDGSFYYIDLRFGDKVFVSEEKPSASTTEPTEVLE